jgi:hypothetical protein
MDITLVTGARPIVSGVRAGPFFAGLEQVVIYETVLGHVDGDSQGRSRVKSKFRQLGSLR